MAEPSGLLIIAKPPGMTSHDVVAKLRRILGIRRIGHAGTLDPMARGVLPLLIGQATRLAEYLLDWEKGYRFTMRLGIATDTYDADGAVTAEGDASAVTRADIEAAMVAFRGTILQTPPPYSAVKRGGRPLYAYARAQQPMEVEPRTVVVREFELERYEPPDASFVVRCGSGTYVRSLAHDIGRALGCGAHVTDITRTAVGPLLLEDAVTIEQVAEAAERGDWHAMMLPPDALVPSAPKAMLSQTETAAVLNGRPVRPAGLIRERREGTLSRAYDWRGRFIALLQYRATEADWKPHKVFVAQPAGHVTPEPST